MPNLKEIADDLPETAWKKALQAAAVRGTNGSATEADQGQAANHS